MATVQFRVWTETSDLIIETEDRAEADEAAERARAACSCGEPGDLACGVLSPHGIHVQITEGDLDVTAYDYGQY